MTTQPPVMGTVTNLPYHPVTDTGTCDAGGIRHAGLQEMRQRDQGRGGGAGDPAENRTRTVRRVRECVGYSARAETTEAWSDEDAAEFYLARYQQAAEWLGNLAFLLKAPTATAKQAEDWIWQDLKRHAGVGLGRTGGRQRIASKARRKSGKSRSA